MTPTTEKKRPPLWQALSAVLSAFVFYVLLRFYIYEDQVVPLTYALPLLLTLWHGRRWLNFTLAAGFTCLASYKLFFVPMDSAVSTPVSFAMMATNIWLVALVVDRLVVTRERLQQSNARLTLANEELEASNEELAAREEEITSQNEELRRQAEELEQQMEELQQQSEELQQQSEEMLILQQQAQSREKVLQALFQISTGLGLEDESERAVDRICEATIRAFGLDASAALLFERVDGELVLQGEVGLSESGKEIFTDAASDPLARMVCEQQKAACVEDLAETPEIFAPELLHGKQAAAVLVTPLVRNKQLAGAIVVYTAATHRWTEVEFETAEWLSSHGALLLEAMHLQAELDARKTEAEEASRRKTQFLAAVSHDVRTPVNTINLTAELIQQADRFPDIKEDMPRLVEGLRSNARQLVELVSDVLDLSRLDSGKIELNVSEFDLCDLLNSESKRFQTVAKNAGLELLCQLPATPLWIRSDRLKLVRVVSNLVGNAIKFTEQGSVRICCDKTLQGVDIRIEDSGIGIPHDQLEHIFDEFFQVRNPERDRSKGTGLGLAICQRLVDGLGCSISIRSELEMGTTVTIHIPEEQLVMPPSQLKMDDEARSQCAESLLGVRVLLVEDHTATREAVSKLLQLNGAVVEAAEDARDALRALSMFRPEVLLLDLMLPDMDGREVLKHLAQQRPESLQCVLAVSGDVTDARLAELRELGADGFVAKPIKLEALIELIRQKLASDSSQPGFTSRKAD